MNREAEAIAGSSSNQENEDPTENSENIYTFTDGIHRSHPGSSKRKLQQHKSLKKKKSKKSHDTSESETSESVSDAFRELRDLLPVPPRDRVLSRVEILRLAASYIAYLHATLEKQSGIHSTFRI